MSGERRDLRVMSAAPEMVQVSLLGERTQVDIPLPADVPVAVFLPELARLIASRDTRDDDGTDRDERRTFWTLRRVDGDSAFEPEETLRGADVKSGELLRITTEQALSPPTLYDDVVDAAARLNRAAYAAWDATAASIMALAGLWLCSAVWVYFLAAESLSAHRGVIFGGAVLMTVTILIGAVLVHRTLGRTDIAGAAGWPLLTLSAALVWDLTAGFGRYGLAAGFLALLVLAAVYYRVIGTGHWAYIAAAVVFVLGAVTSMGSAFGGRAAVLAPVIATTATLGCLAVPALTARLAGLSSPKIASGAPGDTAVPRAEDVWAKVRSEMLARAGVYVGLGAVTVAAAAGLQRINSGWPVLCFALLCAAVLALRSRRPSMVAERAALAVPATVLVLIACVQAGSGSQPLPIVGIGVLAVIVVAGTLAGLVAESGPPAWVPTAAGYLEYAATTALIPMALWAMGIYDRLGW